MPKSILKYLGVIEELCEGKKPNRPSILIE